MDQKSRFLFRILFGAIIITGVIFLVLRYLFKGSPVIKVLALGLICGTVYLVFDYLIRKNRKQ